METGVFWVAPEANRRGFNQLGGFPWNNHRWHAICSLIGNLQDWPPGVAGTEPRLGYRFWGVNYEKGACTSPLFHFYALLLLAATRPAWFNRGLPLGLVKPE